MSVEKLYQRDVYGKTLVELGRNNPDVVVLDADLSGSTRTAIFAAAFPERFFNFGVAEQNMIGAAAGLAACGKTVFASTFAMFATGRAWDQVRNSVCYSNLNVKIVATHAGLTVGPDGATHQALEDIAIMRAIPNMKVIVPCDGPQTREAILTAALHPGPFYVRLGRAKVCSIPGKKEFELGRAEQLRSGDDVAVIACGIMVKEALDAAETLQEEGISCTVLNMHTLKPFDAETLAEVLPRVKGVVVCEEHSTTGGLAAAVQEVMCKRGISKPFRNLGVENRFGQSGEPDELLRLYGLQAKDIVTACQETLGSK